MALTMPRPFKHPKTHIYWTRIMVPKALRPIIGRRELLKTLGTKDADEAKRLHLSVLSEFQERIADARRRLTAGVPMAPEPARKPIKPIRTGRYSGSAIPNENDMRAAVLRWLHEGLRDDMAVPITGNEVAQDHMLTEAVADLADLADFSSGQNERALEGILRRVLDDLGYTAPPLALRSIGIELMRAASIERMRISRDRLTGQADAITIQNPALVAASPLLAAPPNPSPTKPALTVDALMEAWAAEAQPVAGTKKKYTNTLRRIAKIIGKPDVTKWTAEDVIGFKQTKAKAGVQPATIANDVLSGSAVFKWAVQNRHVAENVFTGMAAQVGKRGDTSREPYSDEDAKRILTAARKETGWARWVPWLLCFTGARIGELADMRRGDVRKECGVWVVDVRPTPVRPLKTRDSQRMIPVHPALVEEGFLGYVEGLAADPAGPLFPSIDPDPRGGRASTVTTWMSRWMRGVVGIKDKSKAPSHSWRHRMEDELRKVRALPEVQDAITGHSNPRNAGANYGKGFRGMPNEVLKDLERIPSPLPPLGPHVQGPEEITVVEGEKPAREVRHRTRIAKARG